MDFMVHTGNAKCELAFQAARKHLKECRRAGLDIDWRVRNAVAKWKRVDR